ncbi:helix-turn-helix transcriptional regulator [Paenibacillus massiliensis]|uniref:helix-turn-helix transcriptional regulator n=1 Tax=Paenibacillus massiliensis TaxID=225917 RepID=UPI00227727BB|nr:WYL domain-containing protein [Paenibacillus massiliensis]
MEQNRLFRMLLLLLEKKKTTAPELARLFEISVRTVYRDIDRLSAAGIPIYTTMGKHGGIHLMDNYVMDKSLLSEDEQNEILLGLYSVSAIPHLNSAHMLKRLTTLFDHKLDWIEFEYSPWDSAPAEEMELFNQVKQGIFTRQLISFDYVDSNGGASKETAQPVKLIFKNNSWYFKGIKYIAQQEAGLETYKIKRITELRFVSEVADSSSAASVEERVHEEHEMVQLEMLFSRAIAYRVPDYFDPLSIRREVDGRLRVSVHIEEGERLYSFLMSFGAELTVLKPDKVREQLLIRHQKAVEHLRNRDYKERIEYEAKIKNS